MKEASANSELKKAAGYWAAQLVKDGMTVGIGTGSTAVFFAEKLKERMEQEQLRFYGVATSFSTKCLCDQLGIPMLDMASVEKLDLAVDGADEVDANLNAIKGGGAAQTLEKIAAGLAGHYVSIIDEGKWAPYLAKNFPVPVEVVPAAWRSVKKRIGEMGFDVCLRMAKFKDGPVVTDNGNLILDITLGHEVDVEQLNQSITMLPGVLETGFFIGYADEVCVSTKNGLEIKRR